MPFAAVGAAVGLVGAGVAANSANKASKAQQQSAQQALDLQRQQFDTSRADMAPYRDIGTASLNRIADLLKLDRAAPVNAPTKEQFTSYSGGGGGSNRPPMDPLHELAVSSIFGKKKKASEPVATFDQAGYDAAMEKYNQDMAAFQHRPQGLDVFEADPGYQFRLGEGNKAIENASRARGMYFSPSTVKELTRYGQGFASNEFGNVFNRLSGLAGTGQTAVNTGAQLGQNYATNAGNTIMGAGNARGAASIAQGNIWGNAANQIGTNLYQQNMLKNMFNNKNPSYYSGSGFGGNNYYDSSGSLLPGYGVLS